MMIAILTLLALLSAAMTIGADSRGPRWPVYVCKPMTMAFIIGIALIAGAAAGPAAGLSAGLRYKWLIAAGLGFSLIGDVLMMLPKKRFTEGLFFFLAAHICYIGAFLSGLRFRFATWPLVPLIAFAFVLLWILYPRMGKMRIPVILYVLVILTMARAAIERSLQIPDARAFCAMAGALAFLISDSTLALNRFVKSFKSAQAVILSTYFIAQILIALSV